MPTFLVTGATGVQGGAVVSHLLAAGAKIHAVVRYPTSPASQALKSQGVVLFQGTHESPSPAFDDAAIGCTGIFLNLSVFDPSLAYEQAATILSTCLTASPNTLTTVVLSSTTRVDSYLTSPTFPTTVANIDPFLGAYYAAKSAVERAVRDANFTHHVILRPGVLMHDYLLPVSAFAVPDLPRSAIIKHAFSDSSITIPHTDPDDVGRFAATALLDPVRFSGAEFDVVGENLHADRVGEVLEQVSGVQIKVHKRREEEVQEARGAVMTQKFELLQNESPSATDVEALVKRWGLGVRTLEDFMVRNRDRLVESLPPRADGKY